MMPKQFDAKVVQAFERRASLVRFDHYLQKCVFWLAIMMTWLTQGATAAIVAGLALFGLVLGGNTVALVISGSPLVVRINRWIWPVALLALLARGPSLS